MCGIPCKVFLVRRAAIRGVGVGGVHRMPLPRRSPGPTDPITAPPAPHHTMHRTPALHPALAPSPSTRHQDRVWLRISRLLMPISAIWVGQVPPPFFPAPPPLSLQPEPCLDLCLDLISAAVGRVLCLDPVGKERDSLPHQLESADLDRWRDVPIGRHLVKL